MKHLRPALLACLFAATCSLTGCIAAHRSYEDKPTAGQELIDLKAALDSGAINEQEYNRLKEDIMRDSRSRDRH